MRSIQSGEKECANLSGRSWHGYLVFSSAQSAADDALLAQMGVAKSDFSQMRRSRSDLIKNAEHFAWIGLI